MADNISIVSVVQSLRDKLSADPTPPPPKILRTLQKLAVLPISIDVLHETGIGKVVNGFRKYEGEISESARSLVRSWKGMVREAMDEEANRQETSEVPPQSSIQSKASPRPPQGTTSKTYSPSKNQSHQSQDPVKSQSTSRPHNLTKRESLPKSQSPNPSIKSKSLSKSLNTSSSHSPSKLGSSKHQPSGELKRHRADDIPEGEYTQLKEKYYSPVESPVKKIKSHHSSGDGTAKGQVKRENVANESPKAHISSEKKVTKYTHKQPDKSHDSSHDRSHGKTPLSGVKKSSEHTPTSHSGLNHTSREKQHNAASTSIKKVDVKSNTAKDKFGKISSLEKKPESSPKKIVKSVKQEKSTPNGHTESIKSASTKTDAKDKKPKVSKTDTPEREKAKPTTSSQQESLKTPKTVPSNSDKETSKHQSREDKQEDDDNQEDVDNDAKNYHNTGMSFGDCLLGPMLAKVKKAPMLTKVKKVAKSKTSQNVKIPSKSKGPNSNSKSTCTQKTPANTSRSKVKDSKSDPSKSKVIVESSKAAKSGEGKNLVTAHHGRFDANKEGESSLEGQSSGTDQRTDGARRHRKKRSMSEEEEEAIKMAKKVRRESSDVSLNLPEIQPNYKPMRLPDVTSPLKKRGLTPEEEKAFLGSKQGRTKVFSGRTRVNRLTSVPRLFDICMEVLCDHIDALDEVGGVPYGILYPVLQRCTPQQLFHLEDCNPHFLEESDSLWQKHTERDFKGRRPAEMESWRELYIREHDTREAKLKSITANISAQMAAKDPGRLTKMAFLDRPAKPPRNVMRQQQRHGTASGNFMPEKRSQSSIQPTRPPSVMIDSSGADVSGLQRRQARPVKVVAPMMMKTLKMIKKLRR